METPQDPRKLRHMRSFRLLLAPAVLLFSAPAPAQRTEPPAAKAGVVTREVTPKAARNWRGAAAHSLHVTLWYPAAESATETPQTSDRQGNTTDGTPAAPLFEAGRAAPHAAFAPSLEPFPLVLLSPDAGGSALQLGWLGTALARAGFVVAAVDHPGDNNVTGVTPEGIALWWERATDLSEVLDGLLADAEFSSHIDRGRIGAAGFALGGFTALELAGARTDIAAFYDRCRAVPADPACRLPESVEPRTPAALLERVRRGNGESLARSGDSYRDPRVRAVLALAPALAFTQTADSLHGLRVPVALLVGAADTVAPAATNADWLKRNIRGARETVLPGVAHETFLPLCTSAGKAASPAACSDPAGVDRAAVHAQAGEQAAQFFGKALR